jgi:hypothetical protein
MIRGVVNETCSDINDPENGVEDYASLLKIIGVSLAIGAAGGQLIGRATQALIASVKSRIGRQPKPEVINRVTKPEAESKDTEVNRNMSAQADEGMRAATRARNERVQPRVQTTQGAYDPPYEDAYPIGHWGPNIGVQHGAPTIRTWESFDNGVAPPAPSQEEIIPRSLEHDFSESTRDQMNMYAAQQQLARPPYSREYVPPGIEEISPLPEPDPVRNGQDFLAGEIHGNAQGASSSEVRGTALRVYDQYKCMTIISCDQLWHKDHDCGTMPKSDFYPLYEKSRRRPCMLCGNARGWTITGPSHDERVTVTPGGEIWPTYVTVTPGGAVWHRNHDCSGMRNATAKLVRQACRICVNTPNIG